MTNVQKILNVAPGNIKNAPHSRLDVPTVRAAMARKGWDLEEFASRLGIGKGALSVALTKNIPQLALRLKMEAALDYSVSLVSDPARLTLRQRCFAALGFDFDLLTKPELREKCAALNVRDWRSQKNSDALLEKLLAHLAANPSLLNKTKIHDANTNRNQI